MGTVAHHSCTVGHSCGSAVSCTPPAFLPTTGKAVEEELPASFLLPVGFHTLYAGVRECYFSREHKHCSLALSTTQPPPSLGKRDGGT